MEKCNIQNLSGVTEQSLFLFRTVSPAEPGQSPGRYIYIYLWECSKAATWTNRREAAANTSKSGRCLARQSPAPTALIPLAETAYWSSETSASAKGTKSL